ncbi:hypothetical protein B0H10DRAFT_1993261 [Mycena sp. CBHHK59/15]|nr:hypothetical protein B0H10DRAFT_1993261 [Mycena sp. CBHHK59/15]
MLRQALCRLAVAPACQRVNRVALFSSTSLRAEAEAEPAASKAGARELVLASKTPVPSPPESSTTPLEDSDYAQYVKPLYANGWGMYFAKSARGQNLKQSKNSAVEVLHRVLPFSSKEDMLAFTKRAGALDVDATIDVNLVREKAILKVFVTSPLGVTREQVRAALQAEAEYQKLPSSDTAKAYMAQPQNQLLTRAALATAATYAGEVRSQAKTTLPTPALTAFAPQPLPAPPAAPADPPPSITEADLRAYIAPLMANAWYPTTVRTSRRIPLRPALRRIYVFADHAVAWEFAAAVVEMLPERTEDAIVGPEFRMRRTAHGAEVAVTSVSKLAEGERQKYGISHNDVRFAIELENMFVDKFSARAQNLNASEFRVPTTMDELWDLRLLRAEK